MFRGRGTIVTSMDTTERPIALAAGHIAPTAVASRPADRWHTPLVWRILLMVARILVPGFCRLRVTGEVPVRLREGPLIFAANHIGDFDPVAMTAACQVMGLAPRMMATAGLFRAPIVGSAMRASGHIPVKRWQADVGDAAYAAADALKIGSHILIYPEGRISLDPGLWPERAKTGPARMALASGAPVIPVAQWGAHEVMAYQGRRTMFLNLISSIWRRPTVQIHFGAPVDLSDLRQGGVGHARIASDRIIDAITANLATLRPDEPRLPRHVDPSRPLSLARQHRRARVQR
jgi:1-acyl-sn-glycerol-3-phosphate acyltransferase